MGNSSSTIVVSGLRPNISEQELENYFKDKGRIQYIDSNSNQPMMHMRLERDPTSGKDIGVAMVTFATEESAQHVINNMHGTTLEDQNLLVQSAPKYYEQCIEEGRFRDMAPPSTDRINSQEAWKLWFGVLISGPGGRNTVPKSCDCWRHHRPGGAGFGGGEGLGGGLLPVFDADRFGMHVGGGGFAREYPTNQNYECLGGDGKGCEDGHIQEFAMRGVGQDESAECIVS